MLEDTLINHIEYELDSESMDVDNDVNSTSNLQIDSNVSRDVGTDVELSDEIQVPVSVIGNEMGLNELDDGSKLLYQNLMNMSPLKTSERILDDILSNIPLMKVINSKENCNTLRYNEQFNNSILKQPMIEYSKLRATVHPDSIGSIVDQIVIQSKFEYKSVTCPNHNKIEVFMGVLIDSTQKANTLDDLSNIIINHVKITVKTRTVLERTRRLMGLSKFHLVKELHPFDQKDLLTFDKNAANLIDHAIYVSEDTNKLILIEIFNPEFDSQEERGLFTPNVINQRYLHSLAEGEEPSTEDIPTGIECINTLFKVFKGPLTRKSSNDPIKRINSDNPILRLHMNPEWLVSKYGFNMVLEKDVETGDEFTEYEPPDLTDYVSNQQTRKIRESVTRKCLELIFFGKMMINLLSKEELEKSSKSLRTFNLLQTSFSTSFFKLLIQERGVGLPIENQSNYNIDYHFINLSVSYHYSERDIIQMFEVISKVDPDNIGHYYDSLQFIANAKGSYQLIAYCSKLDIVGQESLETAIKTFNLDLSVTALSSLEDSVIMSIYQAELKNKSLSQERHVNLRNALQVLASYKKSKKLKFFVDYEPYLNTRTAYNMLEIDESIDDDIIQTAYSIKVNDAPGLKLDCDRALYTIAIARRSISLFNFLLENNLIFQEYYTADTFSYTSALSLLQVNENASDENILEVFQKKWFEEAMVAFDHLLKLKAALTKIAFQRNSKLISNFLETGVIDPSCLPAENWPTGLNNIGNTCYLNSLLQYYFAISPLRDEIINYTKTVDDIENNLQLQGITRRVGGRVTNTIEVERSVQFVYQLRDLFSEMIYSHSRCVTPKKELAYLAFAPSNVEVEFDSEDGKSQRDNISTETVDVGADGKNDNLLVDFDSNIGANGRDEKLLVDLDSNISDKIKEEEVKKINTLKPVTSTRVAKISPDQLENALEMGRQQDVTECIGNVLNQLESASIPLSLDDDEEQNDLLKNCFLVKTKQSIIPLEKSKPPRNKIERFLSLLVNIGDHPKNIYDALDLYFNDELLQMEEYGEVRKTLSITEFPSILQIQIQRVYYDREKFIPFKSIEPLPFGNVLYMDRYAELDNKELIDTKNKARIMKKELANMKKRQKELLSRNELGLSRKESLIETKRLLMSDVLDNNGIDVPMKTSLISQIEANLLEIDRELTTLFNNIRDMELNISNMFKEFQSIKYNLFAVFIHRGEASYGHYWTYIKDFQQNSIWRKYNDETITEVPDSEVFNFIEGNTATPYFLVYVKNENIDDIEPLKRIVSDCA
ncbi:hypothetical protein TPHA_0E01710 [Tetrapisispora phaffii CBS 4417]|uniref:Ubiquitin carboxyl-terminal hydrolase 2 n=1 Tax=Tetrapisispora phaffii (strain ATCC 24235 / CBS 4417 / NBRC 1672 / NRRL Y-8282 / UCD 70-5) TaxID=1071381 RepID=G8BTN6_TETPH|nr:hypothetical protein TPHA_0E01710 [Tetrapisispora phaffii CBS 4417]CCE63264.1 hypothetical protein TPHA_0E01710 [Tetrapisispora phaffii CBS 4417]